MEIIPVVCMGIEKCMYLGMDELIYDSATCKVTGKTGKTCILVIINIVLKFVDKF